MKELKKKYYCKELDCNNEISLCLSCHMKTNANREHWMAYFKEYKYGTV